MLACELMGQSIHVCLYVEEYTFKPSLNQLKDFY